MQRTKARLGGVDFCRSEAFVVSAGHHSWLVDVAV